MMFKIPKPLRRTKFDKLFSIELNDFDVERLLPTLFNLVVTRGRNRTWIRENSGMHPCRSWIRENSGDSQEFRK